MSLKEIPVENPSRSGQMEHFNPGSRLKKKNKKESGSLKELCLKLIGYINRGRRYTYDQIDELVMGMHRSILDLQKKKHQILKKRRKN